LELAVQVAPPSPKRPAVIFTSLPFGGFSMNVSSDKRINT